MRKRINPNALCSSYNYECSRRIHREYIRRFHSENILEIESITESIKIEEKYFVSCFGKLVEVTKVEATKVEQSIKIIKR